MSSTNERRPRRKFTDEFEAEAVRAADLFKRQLYEESKTSGAETYDEFRIVILRDHFLKAAIEHGFQPSDESARKSALRPERRIFQAGSFR